MLLRFINNKQFVVAVWLFSALRKQEIDILKSFFFFQKMYKDEAEKMLCNYSAVPDTPEMERIKSTQKNISAVSNSDFLFTCNFSDIFSLNRLSSASA